MATYRTWAGAVSRLSRQGRGRVRDTRGRSFDQGGAPSRPSAL